MMKRIMLSSVAVISAMSITGCQMCTEPIPNDPSCIEPTHQAGTTIDPKNLSYTTPVILPTQDAFQPVYESGTTRVTAIGSGTSLEDATNDAMAKIIANNKCDYVVAITRVITRKSHPAGFFRLTTTNYTVSVSGLPIYLKSLKKVEKPTVKKAENTGCKCPTEKELTRIISNTVINVVKTLPAPAPAPALVRLQDINLSMTAKASSDSPVAIAVPAPKCPIKK